MIYQAFFRNKKQLQILCTQPYKLEVAKYMVSLRFSKKKTALIFITFSIFFQKVFFKSLYFCFVIFGHLNFIAFFSIIGLYFI